MSKSILLSIKPRFVADILNGRKTIEIRKTKPKCDLPITVYIYCTKDNKVRKLYESHTYQNVVVYMGRRRDTYFSKPAINRCVDFINGKVVAKFTVRKVEKISYSRIADSLVCGLMKDNELCDKSCLSREELVNYLKYYYEEGSYFDKQGYAYHIEDLVIFDEPKELNEFSRYHEKKNEYSACWTCKRFGTGCMSCKLTKAPQSWCYVESEE